MNIFEALSQGKGSINEENTSSFLAYLLNPEESHGLRREFLTRFLSKIDCQDCVEWNIDLCLEEPCKEGQRKSNRCVDILIALTDEETKKQKLIAIENKVAANAADSKQFCSEYSFLRKNSNYKKHTISMVFVSPEKEKKLQTEYDNLSNMNKEDTKHSVTWPEITQILKEILQDEANCKIPPIMDYLKHTLKAFIYYIDNTLQKSIVVKYDKYPDEEFILFQMSDGSMRIRCHDGLGLMPKLMIFDVLFELFPNERKKLCKGITATNIFIGYPSALGDKMFKELRKRNLSEVKIKNENPQFSRKKRRKGSNEF